MSREALALKNHSMSVNLTCKQAVDYISKKEEGKLSSWQRVKLWQHLAICSLCRAFSSQNKIITHSFSQHSKFKEERLTDQQKNEIISSIEQEEI